jgi:hypothetical protein
MADYLKEMREAVIEGARRILLTEILRRQDILGLIGQAPGTGVAYGGNSGGDVTDDRATTGYDPVTGLTTVAFVTGVSPVNGTDVWSM